MVNDVDDLHVAPHPQKIVCGIQGPHLELARAFHEAGHAIVLVALGGEASKVSIVTDGGSGGRVVMKIWPGSTVDVAAFLHAGLVAQQQCPYHQDDGYDYGGDDNLILQRNCPNLHDQFVGKIKASYLVKRHWNAIEQFAFMLWYERELPGDVIPKYLV